MTSLCTALKAQYPRDRRPPAVRVVTLHEQLLARSASASWMLLAIVVLLLVAASANLASLVLGRASCNVDEAALRSALGASAGRLALEQAVDVAVVVLTGGAAGLVLGLLALRSVLLFSPPTLPRIAEARLDLSIAFFALCASAATLCVAAVVPILRVSRRSARAGWGARSMTRDSRLMRRVLVGIDAMLVAALLVPAVSMATSALRMRTVALGFDARGVVVAEVNPTKELFDKKDLRAAVERELLRQAKTRLAVDDVTIAADYPFIPYPRLLEDVQLPNGDGARALVSGVSANYFAVMGIARREGRLFAEDAPTPEPVAIISKRFSRQYFRTTSPLGQRLRIGDRPYEIIGVADDVAETGTSVDSQPGLAFVVERTRRGVEPVVLPRVYVPRDVSNATFLMARLKYRGDHETSRLRKIISRVNPGLAVAAVDSLEQQINRTLADNRFYATTVVAFALTTLFLAVVGIYGVVAQSVAQRRREMAIRMAVGGRRVRVVTIVVAEAVGYAVAGAVAGIAVAATLVHQWTPFLFGGSAESRWAAVSIAFVVLALAVLGAAVVPTLSVVEDDPGRLLRDAERS